jgi:hypothetical protein
MIWEYPCHWKRYSDIWSWKRMHPRDLSPPLIAIKISEKAQKSLKRAESSFPEISYSYLDKDRLRCYGVLQNF